MTDGSAPGSPETDGTRRIGPSAAGPAGPRTAAEKTGGGSDAALKNDLRVVARNSTVKLVGSIANGALGLALLLVLTHGVGPRGTGAFLLALSVFNLAVTVAQLGADTGFMRMIPRYRALRRTFDVPRTLAVGLAPVLILGVGLAAVLFIFAEPISQLITHHAGGEVVTYVRILAVFMPLSALSNVVLVACLGFGTITPSVLIDNLAKPFIRPILFALVVVLGIASAAFALIWGATVIAGLLVGFLMLARLSQKALAQDGVSGEPRSYADLGGEFWRFTTPRIFDRTFSAIAGKIGILMVGALAGTSVAGVFSASARLMYLGLFIGASVVGILSPQISGALAQRDVKRTESLFQMATWWLMMTSWPVYLIFAIFAPVIIRIFGHGFTQGDIVLVIGSFAVMIVLATGPVAGVLLMAGYSGLNLFNSILGFTTNIGLNLLLIPRMGLLGAVVAVTSSMVLVNLVTLTEVRLLVHVDPFGKGFAVVGLSALACYGLIGMAARLTLGVTIPALVLGSVLATVPFVTLMWRFRSETGITLLFEAFKSRGRRRGRRARAGGLAEGAAAPSLGVAAGDGAGPPARAGIGPDSRPLRGGRERGRWTRIRNGTVAACRMIYMGLRTLQPAQIVDAGAVAAARGRPAASGGRHRAHHRSS